MTDKTAHTLTPDFRLAFPALLQPQSYEGKPGAYGLMLLIPKAADMSALKAMYLAAVPAGTKGVRPLLRDGDTDQLSFPGFWFCRAKSKFRPVVVSPSGTAVLTDEQVAAKCYPGCWMRARVSAYYYDKQGNKGVSLNIESLQWLRDGEPMVQARSAMGQFDSAGSDAALDATAAGDAATEIF